MDGAGRAAEARRFADSAAGRIRGALARGQPYAEIIKADNIALYYAWIGDVERALYWTEQSARVSTASATWLVINSRVLERVRRDPRWTNGIGKLNADIWREVSASNDRR